MRSTGVGWALGIGRIGSIIGPALGGLLLSLEWTPRQILMAGMIPAACAAVAVFLSGRVYTVQTAFRAEADVSGAP
jgi:AAHS family 4-hydroxybenzoate transporter-like MFS transporter